MHVPVAQAALVACLAAVAFQAQVESHRRAVQRRLGELRPQEESPQVVARRTLAERRPLVASAQQAGSRVLAESLLSMQLRMSAN